MYNLMIHVQFNYQCMHLQNDINQRIKLMEMQKQIKPQFHYAYKKQGIILDLQYNYQGSILAVATSQGEVLFYEASSEQPSREPIHIISENKIGSVAILKIAWSDPNFRRFVTTSIQKQIKVYYFQSCNPVLEVQLKCQSMPSCLSYCPNDRILLLNVGFSNGCIGVYGEKLQLIKMIEAHQQSVNCLSWETRIRDSSKNNWITKHFGQLQVNNSQFDFPLLISCSSDMLIKIWKYEENNLIQLGSVKAHDKQIRQVQWKPSCFQSGERTIVSCSEDGFVRIWLVTIASSNNARIMMKTQRNFDGPVYKANYNYSGTSIAICYLKQTQEKVQTCIMSEKNGILSEIQKL